jgi:release factor glutamine methyltransferase
VPSAELASEVLLMHVLGRDRSYLYSHHDQELQTETVEHYHELIAERAAGKPTQYITGHQEFWGT